MQTGHSYHRHSRFYFLKGKLALICIVWLMLHQQAMAQDGQRSFGPLEINFDIDSVQQTAICRFVTNSKVLATATVGLSGSSTFNITQAGFSSRGMLTIQPDAGNKNLALQINFWYRSGRDSIAYAGALAFWPPAKTIASGDTAFVPDYILTPLLRVRVKAWGPAKNIASVALIYGESVVFSTALTQPAPLVYTTGDIILGDLTIKKGMTIQLAIPSTLINGSITLDAQYSTTNTPLTPIHALIASWPLY